MKFIIILLLAVASAHAIFPKLVLKYDSAEEDGPLEETVMKFPKFHLFGKPSIFDKLEAKKDKWANKPIKPTLLDKIIEKKEDKFEDRLLNFFEDKHNAKTIFDKLNEYKFKKPAEPVKCKCDHTDDCDDGIHYFS